MEKNKRSPSTVVDQNKELNTNYDYKYGGDGPHNYNHNYNKNRKTHDLTLTSELLNNSAIHGSMENLHHPKNYRSRGFTPAPKQKRKSQYEPRSPQAGPSRLIQCSNGQVAADTKALQEYIMDERRKTLVRKAVASFTFGALRKQANRLIELETFQRRKAEESAARLILHNLLLNSWRNTKIDLERLSTENAQLSIAVENLGLQLRVVRHLQTSEKERASEKANEIRQLKSQVSHYVQATKNAEGEIKSLEEELRYANEDKEKLVAQRDDVALQLENASEEKEVTLRKMESERRRANRSEDELASLKLELSELRKQVRDLTAQSAQWQERAREFESMSWEMKLNLETRDTALAALKDEYDLLTEERNEIRIKKDALREAYNGVSDQLAGSLEENAVLKAANDKISTALGIQRRKRMDLEESLHNLKTENHQILTELYAFKLKNVRNRRAWVEAIRCLTSPSRLWAYLAGNY